MDPSAAIATLVVKPATLPLNIKVVFIDPYPLNLFGYSVVRWKGDPIIAYLGLSQCLAALRDAYVITPLCSAQTE